MRGVVVLVIMLAAAGCSTVGGDIQRMINAYQDGDFADAVKRCQDLKPRVDAMNHKGRVRFLVFCGLSLYESGHRQDAREWLRRGEQEYMRGDPRWLHANAVTNMKQALAAFEHAPAEVPSTR